MSDIIEKLSSYNILNYLLPGAVFCLLASWVTRFDLLVNDVIAAPFFYYFCGMVISRFGSLVFEPLFKILGVVTYSPYSEYLRALEVDDKIEMLSEVSNTYRTMASVFFMLGLVVIFQMFIDSFPIDYGYWGIVLITLLFILFVFSYSKQTRYIQARINEACTRKDV